MDNLKRYHYSETPVFSSIDQFRQHKAEKKRRKLMQRIIGTLIMVFGVLITWLMCAMEEPAGACLFIILLGADVTFSRTEVF